MLDLNQFDSVADALERVQPGDEYDDVVRRLFAVTGGELTELTMFFLSAVARANGLHHGIAQAIAAENPHAAFPLIRQFAETVAVVLYVADNPHYARVISTRPDQRSKGGPKRRSMQYLVNYMDKNHADQFGAVWKELCEATHYGAVAWALPFTTSDDEDRDFEWRSRPHWKNDRDALIACAQTLECADTMETALNNLGARIVTAHRAAQGNGKREGAAS